MASAPLDPLAEEMVANIRRRRQGAAAPAAAPPAAEPAVDPLAEEMVANIRRRRQGAGAGYSGRDPQYFGPPLPAVGGEFVPTAPPVTSPVLPGTPAPSAGAPVPTAAGGVTRPAPKLPVSKAPASVSVPRIPPLRYIQSPPEARFETAQQQVQRAMRSGVLTPEFKAQARDEQRMALAGLGRALPALGEELKRNKARLDRDAAAIQAAQAAAKQGGLSARDQKALAKQVDAYNANVQLHAQRIRRLRDYGKRFAAFARTHEREPVHSGFRFPEEGPEREGPVSAAFSRLAGVFSPAAVATNDKLQRSRAQMMLAGEYPWVGPNPGRTPGEKAEYARQLRGVREFVQQEALNATASPQFRAGFEAQRTAAWTPWQREVLPRAREWWAAEQEARRRTDPTKAVFTDVAAAAAAFYGGLGTAGLLAKPLAKLAPGVRIALTGAGAGGVGSSTAAGITTAAMGGTPREIGQAMREAFAPGALIGATAGLVQFAWNPSVEAVRGRWNERTPKLIDRATQSVTKRFGLTPEQAKAYRAELVKLARSDLTPRQKSQVLNNLIEGLQPGQAAKAPKPVPGPIEEYVSGPQPRAEYRSGRGPRETYASEEGVAGPGGEVPARTGGRFDKIEVLDDGTATVTPAAAEKAPDFGAVAREAAQEQGRPPRPSAEPVQSVGGRQALQTVQEPVRRGGLRTMAPDGTEFRPQEMTSDQLGQVAQTAALAAQSGQALAPHEQEAADLAARVLGQHAAYEQQRATEIPPGQREAFVAEWTKPGNQARGMHGVLTGYANKVAETNPALAAKLAAAADSVYRDAVYRFRQNALTGDELLDEPAAVAPALVSLWRTLTPEERRGLPSLVRQALLILDVSNSVQVLDPEQLPVVKVSGVRGLEGLERAADRLFDQAQGLQEARFAAPVVTPEPVGTVTPEAEAPTVTTPAEAAVAPVAAPEAVAVPETAAAPEVATEVPPVPAVEEAPTYTGPERRTDLTRRKKVAEMTPEERAVALFTAKTGIKNDRAYDESEKQPWQASIDADSLKWWNETLSHSAGDRLLRAVADSLKDAGLDAYHISGDEFVVQGGDPAAMRAGLERANEILKQVEISVVLKDGTKRTFKGAEITYAIDPANEQVGFRDDEEGFRPAYADADETLKILKVEREAAGVRAPRGERPPGLVEVTAGERRGGPEPADRGEAAERRGAEGAAQAEVADERAPTKEGPGRGKPPEKGDPFADRVDHYTPVLFREATPGEVGHLLGWGGIQSEGPMGVPRLWFANTPDLALGQGENRGVLIEIDAAGLRGQINRAKPGWEMAWQSGGAEWSLAGQQIKADQVRSVTYPKRVPKGRGPEIQNIRRQMDAKGWKRTENENGTVTYTRPGVAPLDVSQLPITQEAPAAQIPETLGRKGAARVREREAAREAVPAAKAEGADTEFKAGDQTHSARWAVYDVADLVTSHDDLLRENAAYPKELQPRDRTRQASKEQVAEIAGKFDPTLMGENALAQHGAPIVGPDGVVESGNARTIALRQLYGRKGAKAYQDWLAKNAGRFGLNPADLKGVKRPVLVRVRTSTLTPEQRVEFTRAANARETAAMGAVEQAKVDAERLTPKLLNMFDPGDSGDLLAATNRPFIRAFIETLPTAEQAALRTAEGTISQDGARRIRNAVFQYVYGDTEALTRLAEAVDDPARNITNGMLRAAGLLADLQKRIDAETAYPVNVAGDVARAAAKIATLREQGTSVTEYLAQGGLFGEDLTALQRNILVQLESNKRSAKRIAALLADYVDLATKAGDPSTGSMFEDIAPPEKETLWQAAVDRNQRIATDEPNLFTEEPAGEGATEAVPETGTALRGADEAAGRAAPEAPARPREAEGVIPTGTRLVGKATGAAVTVTGYTPASGRKPARYTLTDAAGKESSVTAAQVAKAYDVAEAGRKGGEVRAQPQEQQQVGPTADVEKVRAVYREGKTARQQDDSARWRQEWDDLKRFATQVFPHLPRTPGYAELQQKLIQFLKGRDISNAEAQIEMAEVVRGLTNPQYDLFNETLFVRDLVEEARRQEERLAETGEGELRLVRDLTPAEVQAALSNVTARLALPENAKVNAALERRREVMGRIKNEYLAAMEAVLGHAPILDREDYFRHQVIKHLAARGISPIGPREVKAPPKRGFTQARTANAELYNSEWITAEHEVLSTMIYDTMLYKLLKYIVDEFDISKSRDLAKKARAEGKRLRDVVPDGYGVYQPEEGTYFFKAWTVPDRLAHDMLEDTARTLGVKGEELREIIGRGMRRPEYVLPLPVIETLRSFNPKRVDDVEQWYRRFKGRAMSAWKSSKLIGPARVFGYNMRNLVGDLEAMMFNRPQGYVKLTRAARELSGYMTRAGRAKGPVSPELREWIRRGGLQSVLQSVEEVGSGQGLDLLAQFASQKAPLTKRAWEFYWNRARLSTDFREAVGRYATYLDYLEQIQEKGRPLNYGASRKREIDAIKDPRDKAWALSNQLLGAYDEVSQFGQLMAGWIPFWRWQEVNWKRNLQLFKNGLPQRGSGGGGGEDAYPLGGGGPALPIDDDGVAPWHNAKLALFVGRRLLGAGIAGGVTYAAIQEDRGRNLLAAKDAALALMVGRFAIRAAFLRNALNAWNSAWFPEAIKYIPDYDRGRPLFIYSYDPATKKVGYTTRLSIFADTESWFGFDNAMGYWKMWADGRMDEGQIAKEMAKAPLTKLVSFGPAQNAAEIVFGRKLFPDPFNSRPIRDRWEYAFDAIDPFAGDWYRWYHGRPAKPGRLAQMVGGRKTDLDEAAYNEVGQMRRAFLTSKGKEQPESSFSAKGNALYNHKLALRYGDTDAADRLLMQYVMLKGSDEGRQRSLAAMDPLNGMENRGELQAEFLKRLAPDDKERVRMALEFYNELAEQGLPPNAHVPVMPAMGLPLDRWVAMMRDRAARLIELQEPIREMGRKNPEIQKLLRAQELAPR